MVKQDKKNIESRIMCTLLNGIGTVIYDQEISEAEVKESLVYYKGLNKY